jgi:cytochrome c2
MDSAIANRGLSWPRLTAQEIADLLTFLSASPGMQPQAEFTVGEAELGRVAFERSCESCHSFGLGAAVRPTVDLLAKSRPSSITGYIAAMWNHAPEMRRRGGSIPKLNAGEMPDLVAYLFAQRYFFDRGDVDRGRRMYEEKKCATCHENRSRELGAPDLFQSSEVYSPITLTSAVWRHGRSMMDRIERQGSDWPVFQGSEMADLIAYLNSKLIIRVAR